MLSPRSTTRWPPFFRAISTKPIIHIPTSSIHPFGDPSNQRPILRNVQWTVKDGEAWAVLSAFSGDRGKHSLFQTLLGNLRVLPEHKAPLQGSFFPFLGEDADPYSRIATVSFSHRSGRGTGGSFYDYTARYGAIRDEGDALTLRESMFPESIPDGKPDPLSVSPSEKPRIKKIAFEDVVKLNDEDKALLDILVKEMDLERLLDLPLVALSNGQMRRARIARGVLRKPDIMLLDEPLTGLDASSRPKLLNLLQKLHEARKPRIILGLRTQDEIPAWVTHIALVQAGTLKTGLKERMIPLIEHDPSHVISLNPVTVGTSPGKIVVDLKKVNVKYAADRAVLKNIDWQIRQGERWHLQGANGSGKTTLLSLILGDHPQSYTQNHLLLPSPPSPPAPYPPTPSEFVLSPRRRIPTANLRQSIGVVSPELFDAFPRRHPGMTVQEAIGTGFEGAFVPLAGDDGIGAIEPGQEALRQWRQARMWEMLEMLGPSAWRGQGAAAPIKYPAREVAQEFARRRFTDLGVAEQRMVLLMRGLVGRPPLVLLDEVWSGMSEDMVKAARRYLREMLGDDQAVVVVTHWEDEVPWAEKDGVKRFRLQDGVGSVV